MFKKIHSSTIPKSISNGLDRILCASLRRIPMSTLASRTLSRNQQVPLQNKPIVNSLRLSQPQQSQSYRRLFSTTINDIPTMRSKPWYSALLRFIVKIFMFFTKGFTFVSMFAVRAFAFVYLYTTAFRGDGTSWKIAQMTNLHNLDPATGKDKISGRTKEMKTDFSLDPSLGRNNEGETEDEEDGALTVDYTKDHQISSEWVPQVWINFCRNIYSMFVLSAVMVDYAIINADVELEKEEDNLLKLKIYLTKRERKLSGLPDVPDADIENRAARALREKKARAKLAREKAKRKSKRSEASRIALESGQPPVSFEQKERDLQEELRIEAEAHAALGILPIPKDPILRRRELEERLVMYDVHSKSIALIRGVLDEEAKLLAELSSNYKNTVLSTSSTPAQSSFKDLAAKIPELALERVALANDVPASLLSPAVNRHRLLLQTHQRNAFRLLTLAHEQGGVYVKAAQYISIATEGIPKQYVRVLSRMHDRAAPLSLDFLRPVFQKEFGMPIEEVFADFSPKAIAAASMAQVHSATLKGGVNSGKRVAVKVQYRHISASLDSDLGVITFLAGLCEKFFPSFVFRGMVEEFGQGIRSELDFSNEGRNGERTAALLRHRPDIHVPAIAWSHTTKRVLTTEFIDGVRVNDIQALHARGIYPSAVLDSFVGAFGEMLFRSGFLHCDPHPGNAMVRVKPALSNTSSSHSGSKPWVNETENAVRAQLIENPEAAKSYVGTSVDSLLPSSVTSSLVVRATSFSYSLFSSLFSTLSELTLIPALLRRIQTFVLFGDGEVLRKAESLDDLPVGVSPNPHQVVLLDHGLYTELSPKFRSGMSRLFSSFLKRDTASAKEACEMIGMGTYWKILHLVFTGRLPGSNRAARSVRWTKEERMQLIEEFQDFDMGDVTAFVSEMSSDLMYFTKTFNTLKSIGKSMGLPDTRQKQLLINAALWGSRQDNIPTNGLLRNVLVEAPFVNALGAFDRHGKVSLDLEPLPALSLKDTLVTTAEQAVFGFFFFFYELFIAKVEMNDPRVIRSLDGKK